MKSSFFWAFVLFVLLNTFLNKEDESRGFAASTVSANSNDYRGVERDTSYIEHAPNVILLGSSLMYRPEWSVDRTIPLKEPWGKQTIISASSYHLAQGLENELTSSGFKDPHVYNLAVGGALISDSYLLLSHYLKAHPKPLFVIIDCAPRSFNDSGVTAPDTTPVFDYCFQLADFLDLHQLYLRGFEAKLNYLLSRIIFTYHHRQWLAQTIQTEVREIFTSSLRAGIDKQPVKSPVLAQAIVTIDHIDSGGTEVSSNPVEPKLSQSLQEYRGRYWCTTRESLATQLRFLQRLTELCITQKIKLIVVNMPLTNQNLQLLGDGVYADYLRDVSGAIHAPATYLDLPVITEWPMACYDDSVHLNADGGKKFNQILSRAVMNYPNLNHN